MRADGRETGFLEPCAQLLDGIGALVVLFKVALPRAIRLAAKMEKLDGEVLLDKTHGGRQP